MKGGGEDEPEPVLFHPGHLVFIAGYVIGMQCANRLIQYLQVLQKSL
jgi:hypothetical protein